MTGKHAAEQPEDAGTDPTNPLGDYPALRKDLYIAYWVLGLLIGTTSVGYAMDGGTFPHFLQVAVAVYGYLGVPLGFTASKNV